MEKEALTQVSFYEFCEIFRKSYFVEQLRTVAAVPLRNQETLRIKHLRGPTVVES